MKHKIKLVEWDAGEYSRCAIEIDGQKLYSDGWNTFCCIEEILKFFDIECELEFEQTTEIINFVTKKMKLVPDEE
jgi:hypothetical protein